MGGLGGGGPSTWYICDFFLFHIKIEGKGGWIIGGGGGGGGGGRGGKLYVAPPLSNYWGAYTHLYKFSFLFSLKLSYEFWFQIAQMFLRKTSFNFEI